jgi:hypothetical protein
MEGEEEFQMEGDPTSFVDARRRLWLAVRAPPSSGFGRGREKQWRVMTVATLHERGGGPCGQAQRRGASTR